jgi:hypothetical protein
MNDKGRYHSLIDAALPPGSEDVRHFPERDFWPASQNWQPSAKRDQAAALLSRRHSATILQSVERTTPQVR